MLFIAITDIFILHMFNITPNLEIEKINENACTQL